MTEPENGAPAPASPSAPDAPKRRWTRRRILLLSLAVVALLILFLPYLAAPFVRSRVIEQAEREGFGQLEIASLSFGWSGALELGGVRLLDAEGRESFRCDRLQADVDVWPALFGSVNATATATGPVISGYPRGEAEVEWPLLEAVRAYVARQEPKPDEPGFFEGDGAMEVTASLADARIEWTAANGRSGALEASGNVSLLRPEPQIKGSLTLREGGELRVGIVLRRGAEPSQIAGRVEVNADGLSVATLAALAGQGTRSERLSGSGQYDFQEIPMLVGSGEYRLSNVAVPGWERPEDLEAEPELTIATEFMKLDDGPGQRFVVRDAEGLSMEWIGRLDSGATGIVGRLESSVDLWAFQRKWGRPSALRPGLDLSGVADLAAQVDVDWGRGVPEISVVIDGRANNLAAREPNGASVELEPRVDLAANARIVPGEKIEVTRLDVDSRAVTARINVGVDLIAQQFESSRLVVDADLDDLAARVGRVFEWQPPVLGRAKVEAHFEGGVAETKLRGQLVVDRLRVPGNDVAAGEGRFDFGASLFLAPGSRLKVDQGSWTGVGTDLAFTADWPLTTGSEEPGRATLAGTIEPVRFGTWAKPLVPTVELAGEPITLEGEVTRTATDLGFRVKATDSLLALGLTGKPVELKQLSLEARGRSAGGTTTLEGVTLRATGVEADVTGRLGAGDDGVDLTAVWSADLAQVDRRLQAYLPAVVAGWPEGHAKADVRLTGSLAKPRIDQKLAIDGFDLRLANPGKPGAPGGAWSEKRLELDSAITLQPMSDAPGVTVGLERVELRSELATGSISGRVDSRAVSASNDAAGAGGLHAKLQGKIDYRANQVAKLIAPWTGTLPSFDTGVRALELDIDGPLTAESTWKLLADMAGNARVELPRLTWLGIPFQGPLITRFDGEGVQANLDLQAGGGKLSITSAVDLASTQGAKSSFEIRFEQVGFQTDTSEVLAFVHPLLVSIAQPVTSGLSGTVTGSLRFEHDAPIDRAAWARGWQALRSAPIGGGGNLQLDGFTLESNDLFAQLQRVVKMKDIQNVGFDRFNFSLRNHRLVYDQPVEMKVDGHSTYWSGSIGFDRTVDLEWRIPLTEDLKRNFPDLAKLPMQELTLPLRGTVLNPQLDTLAFFDQLRRAATEDLINRGRDELIGSPSDNDKAADLFARANRLYEAGDREGAKKLYQELRDNYDKTLVYMINKKRIEKRAD